jgi:flagellar biogenesis protein FliO
MPGGVIGFTTSCLRTEGRKDREDFLVRSALRVLRDLLFSVLRLPGFKVGKQLFTSFVGSCAGRLLLALLLLTNVPAAADSTVRAADNYGRPVAAAHQAPVNVAAANVRPGTAAAARPVLRVTPPSRTAGATIKTSGWASLVTMLAALGSVAALFFVAAWLLKRGMPAGARLLPTEVIEVLGRTPLAGRQQAHLVRIGSKMLVLAVSPNGVETLTEITDPLEVDRLAGLCQQVRPNSTSASFAQMMRSFGGERARGFLGSDHDRRETEHA